MTGLANAAREALDRGTFGYLESTLTTAEINRFFPE
jgi:hypothetical protein